jgi:glycosyltransferase involved in cell wall biosynthesis
VRVLVATSDVPFVEGGHRVIARALVRALQEAGHEAELLTTPSNRFGRQGGAYLANWLTDVELTGAGERVDRLLSLRYPSYVLRHPDHVCWLNHRMREYYDLWDEGLARRRPLIKAKESVRRTLVRAADTHFLRRLRRLYAQSKLVQDGLRRWGGLRSEVLYPPPPPRAYRVDGYEDFVLAPARLVPLKRVGLLIEALARRPRGRAVILGEGPERQNLVALAKQHSLEGRVEFRGRVEESELLDLLARCRAVFYAPRDEDYGLVTLEAFASRKPLLTTPDSGGPAELVANGVSGLVCAPEPQSLAAGLERLFEDARGAEAMGNAGHDAYRHVTWPETVKTLLS